MPARPCRPRLISDSCSSPRRSRYSASFSNSLALIALRFARVVAINSPKDLHLQVNGHAGHTCERRPDLSGRRRQAGRMRVYPFAHFTKHLLSTVVYGDDVSRPLDPYKLFLFRSERSKRMLCDSGLDPRICPRLNDERRHCNSRKRTTGFCRESRKLV